MAAASLMRKCAEKQDVVSWLQLSLELPTEFQTGSVLTSAAAHTPTYEADGTCSYVSGWPGWAFSPLP